MITAMTTLVLLSVLVILLAALVRYARHDHFAGPANTADLRDDLGSVAMRGRVVPRH